MITEATRRRFAELEELVTDSSAPDGRWLVLTHDNPDPDALASASVLARLLRQGFGQRVTCAYGGIIGRAENREMVRILKLEFSHLRHLSFSNYSRFALVDTQPRTGNNQLPEEVTPDLVFDHHPLRKATRSVPFFDVRTEYGATATFLSEYLAAAEVEPTRALATAVVYAIRSETQDFRRESAGPDKKLYDEFLPLITKRDLAKIQFSRQPLEYFRTLHQALENLHSVDTLVVSHLTAVEQPDIVPEIADLLLRLEGKTWSLVTGLFDDRVYLSIRTTNIRADAGRIMRKLVNRDGKGGGHGMIAGGWVAITDRFADDPRKLQETLARRLAKELSKDPAKLQPLELEPPG